MLGMSMGELVVIVVAAAWAFGEPECGRARQGRCQWQDDERQLVMPLPLPAACTTSTRTSCTVT